jgi:dihydroorotate dehydrogenase (fumarate)
LQPDLDLNTLELRPTIHLSHRNELRLRLRWVTILRGQLSVSLAASGGAHLAEDVLKLLLAGSDVAMLASALIRHGARYLEILLKEISASMKKKEFASVEGMKGTVSQRYADRLVAYEWHNYIAIAQGAKPESPDTPVEFAIRSGPRAVESPETIVPDSAEDCARTSTPFC